MAPDNNRPNGAWTIIIPVKDTTTAKTRLTGLSQQVRASLALAFALDTTTAALACPAVLDVLVVTNDEGAARALEEVGARVVIDDPDAGLNAALEHGTAAVRRDRPQACVAAMPGDLPALRPEELEVAFTAGSAYQRWLVADADGAGTTLLAVSGGAPLDARFGTGSRAAHIRSGAVELTGLSLPRLRRDVDTEQQLFEAVA